jgi:hypothetical protein
MWVSTGLTLAQILDSSAQRPLFQGCRRNNVLWILWHYRTIFCDMTVYSKQGWENSRESSRGQKFNTAGNRIKQLKIHYWCFLTWGLCIHKFYAINTEDFNDIYHWRSHIWDVKESNISGIRHWQAKVTFSFAWLKYIQQHLTQNMKRNRGSFSTYISWFAYNLHHLPFYGEHAVE